MTSKREENEGVAPAASYSALEWLICRAHHSRCTMQRYRPAILIAVIHAQLLCQRLMMARLYLVPLKCSETN